MPDGLLSPGDVARFERVLAKVSAPRGTAEPRDIAAMGEVIRKLVAGLQGRHVEQGVAAQIVVDAVATLDNLKEELEELLANMSGGGQAGAESKALGRLAGRAEQFRDQVAGAMAQAGHSPQAIAAFEERVAAELLRPLQAKQGQLAELA